MQLSAGRARGQAGFTLPELLVTATLALSVIGAIATFNSFQMTTLQNEMRQNALQMNARNVVDLFTREVRRAGANPTCAAGIVPIADAKKFSLRLLSDLNGDGALTDFSEDVTYVYRFDNDRFERGGKRGTDSLIEADLAGSRLRYFDANGAEFDPGIGNLTAAQRAAVRRIRIELVATRSSVNDATGPLRVELANDVEIRNRYFGNALTCP